MSDLPKDIEFELAALADGSLTGKRREEALGRVQGSRELQAELAEQRQVVALTTAANAKAPESLRRQVATMLASSGAGHADPSRAARRRLSSRLFALSGPRAGFAAVVVAASIAVVVAIGLAGGGSDRSGSSGLSVQAAAALTLGAATGPAAAENERDRSQLKVAVDGVSFPYWKERFGWRSSGTRTDVLGAHTVTTVFYASSDGRRIGYAIASGQAPRTEGGTVVRRWGVSYRVLEHDGATVVTWQRRGHLCVMAGRGVSARTLVNLASWGSSRSHAA